MPSFTKPIILAKSASNPLDIVRVAEGNCEHRESCRVWSLTTPATVRPRPEVQQREEARQRGDGVTRRQHSNQVVTSEILWGRIFAGEDERVGVNKVY